MKEAMKKRRSKVKMFFLSVGALLAAAVTTAAVSTVFIFTMEQASAKPEEAPISSAVEGEPTFSSAEKPKGDVAQANAKPEKSPAEDDLLVLVNYSETMPDDFHRNIVNLYGVDVDERIVEPFQKCRQLHRQMAFPYGFLLAIGVCNGRVNYLTGQWRKTRTTAWGCSRQKL